MILSAHIITLIMPNNPAAIAYGQFVEEFLATEGSREEKGVCAVG